jgi:hypothetical protein
MFVQYGTRTNIMLPGLFGTETPLLLPRMNRAAYRRSAYAKDTEHLAFFFRSAQYIGDTHNARLLCLPILFGLLGSSAWIFVQN